MIHLTHVKIQFLKGSGMRWCIHSARHKLPRPRNAATWPRHLWTRRVRQKSPSHQSCARVHGHILYRTEDKITMDQKVEVRKNTMINLLYRHRLSCVQHATDQTKYVIHSTKATWHYDNAEEHTRTRDKCFEENKCALHP